MSRSLLAGALLVLLPAAARAQMPPMPVFDEGVHTFALQLGPTKPTATNSFDSAAGNGPALNLQYLRTVKDWIGLGAELSYLKLGSANATNLGLLTRLNLARERSWTPYVLGGVGYHSLSASEDVPAGAADCKPFTAPCTAGSRSGKSSGLTVTGAAGLEFFPLHGLSLSFEARYHEFRTPPSKFSGSVEAMTYFIGFRYWRPPKFDQ